MLTRKTSDSFDTELTIKGQGETVVMGVTYYNRTQDAINEAVNSSQSSDDVQFANRQGLLFIVKRWDSEYPLNDMGVKEMEQDRPGMIEAIFRGYHQARAVELVKN